MKAKQKKKFDELVKDGVSVIKQKNVCACGIGQ